MKKTYKITKVNNKSNYRRIIGEIKKIKEIETFNLNKEKEYLYIETQDEQIEEKILKALHKYEKNATISEILTDTVYRKVLILKGIDCGHCAMRIETLAKREFDHEQIVVDFSTERFIIETKDKNLYDNLIAEVSIITRKVDPRIVVQDLDKKKTRTDLEAKPLFKKHQLIMFIIGILLTIGFVLARTIITKGIGWLHDGTGNDVSSYSWFDYAVLIVALFLVGFQVIVDFFGNIIHRHELDEKFLMTVASIGAVATNHTLEAILVMTFYQVGKFLQDLAVNHSRKSIKALLTFDVQNARLKVDESEVIVEVESIIPGDVLIVKTGEMIPVDGIVESGKSYLDLKALTGEVLSQNVKVGDSVKSGSINLGNVIEIKATKLYKDSTMSEIIDMVENASSKKARSENFIARFAKFYTPIIVLLAFIVAFVVPLFISLVINKDIKTIIDLMFGTASDKGYIYRGMVFLVIACPCALVISVPLAFFSGIGVASKNGILVKGSNYLENLDRIDSVLFDKTGTLTKGEFSVKSIHSVTDQYSDDEVFKLMAYAEYHSTHPIGISITDMYGRDKIFPDIIDEFVHTPGTGVKALINGSRISVCNYKKLLDEKINFDEIDSRYLVLYVLKERQVIGYTEIGDTIKEDAESLIKNLKKEKVYHLAILTGDSKKTSNAIAEELGIDEVHAELMPADKVKLMEEYKANVVNEKHVVYVGDGINDAPVIASADVGIAIGAQASEGSIAIADIVIMDDKLSKIDDAIKIAKKTKRIVSENIFLALFFKVVVLLITFLDIPSMIWLAIFSDVGVSLLAIMNSLRINIQKKEDKKHE